MPFPTLPPRHQIALEHRWNDTSVFPSIETWEAELKTLTADLGQVTQFKGRLAESPTVLADALDALEAIGIRVGKLEIYADMAYAVDTTDMAATKMYGQAQGLIGQAKAAASFRNPELLEIGLEKLETWCAAEPRLALWRHYIADLFRKQAHVRSAEVEELLGLVRDPFGGAYVTASALTNSDFKFSTGVAADGSPVTVAQGTLDKILAGPDREARRTAWENYTDTYLAFKNTLAANLTTSIKQNAFNTRARRYESTLAAALFKDNIPLDVFYNLIDAFQRNLPVWHRYWAARRKVLGVDTLHPYDIWAPLTPNDPVVPYAQAVDWISAGLTPLGEEYVSVLRQGCLQDRWVDIYPNEGKMSGAFSSGSKGTHPFIMMSYGDDLGGLSTLAHELGHSMHSRFSDKHQPFVYTDYSMFVAETASNYNQAMVRDYLFKHNSDRDFQLALIQEAMDNIHRYLFIMPTLARFELETHQRIEQGRGLTADDLISLMADLFAEAYGGEMHLDRERVGITWAQFPHLYTDYYVFQYATGISAAHALAGRTLNGAPNAADDYLKFLKAGSSMYAIDALKMAGVDMTKPDAVDAAFAVLAGYVDRLESLSNPQ